MSAKRFVGYALFFACLILVINFGLRASMGFFLKPVSETHHYGREIFAMSLALQNLFWGLFQPLFGAVADKFGVVKTIIVGAILYALGLYITSIAGSPMLLHTGAGLLVGMGIAATGFGVVLPAMARLVSPEKRSMALGLGTAAGSAGQFLVIPVAKEFIVAYGWQSALVIMALGALSMILFSPALAGRPGQQGAVTLADDSQTLSQALKEASSHVHYWLLIAGFFVCGFQLAFITVHMPSYLSDNGFSGTTAAISLALIGFFNIIGSLISGALAGRYSKKWILCFIYASRAVVIAVFLLAPMTTTSIYLFSIVTGMLWLATIPPTSGMVAQMFGLKYMGTLYGIVFLNHQIGSFFGVWLGGYFYDRTGSYDVVWWAAAIIAGITALIHIPIDERPVLRLRSAQSG